MFAGCAAHSLTGRDKPLSSGGDGVEATNLYSFHVVSALKDVKIKAVYSGPNAAHYAAIDADGGLYMWGRGEKGQLGFGDTKNVYNPTKATGLPPVVHVALGRSHTIAVTADGQLFATGDGTRGQCGWGGSGKEVSKWTLAKVPSATSPFVSVACGNEFSIALDAGGRVYTCGSQEHGQCGSGRTGEHIISAGKVGFAEIPSFTQVAALAGVKVTAIAAGATHGVALSDDGQVYSWGQGGFGRLGHGKPEDMLVPTAIKTFDLPRLRVKGIAAGQSCTYYTLRAGDALYFSGITKKTGEATMVPKMVMDLCGWKTRSVACGITSTIVASEASLITWGNAPTSGELGHGEGCKSSPKAKKVDDLEGCHVLQVASGMAGSLILVDVTSDTKEGRAAAKKVAEGAWPAYAPAEPTGSGSGSSGGGGAVAGAKRGKPGAGAAALGEGAAAKRGRKK